MRLRFTFLAGLSLLGLALSACSGSSSPPRDSVADCGGGGTFCLTACNLGCSIAGTCAVNSIAQNQSLVLRFSQAIDPSSVNPSTISLKTAAGEPPNGSFQVDGSTLSFIPEVSLVAGVTTFGFRANEEYILTLPGGLDQLQGVRSDSGDRLVRTVACTFSIDQGLVDTNNRAPTATLVSPTNGERDVPNNPSIVLEFDELIDVSPFQGASTASSPIQYSLRRTDPVTGEPDQNFQPINIPGVPQAEALLGASPRTRITLNPLIELPNAVCIEVLVTDQVRDLSGTPAEFQSFVFYTSVGEIVTQTVTENFNQLDKFDSSLSSATWGGGALTPGEVGGSGKMGEFDITLLPQDANGHFVWDTDTSVTIPASRTLLGQVEMTAVDGQAEFSRLNIAEGQTLRFVGSKAPLLRVSGDVDIAGTIALDGNTGDDPVSILFGGPGGTGGPGGGTGGAGADAWEPPATMNPPTPHPVPQANHFGQPGSTLVPQGTSGYVGQVGGTGGEGMGPWPESGRVVPDATDPNVDFVNSVVAGLFSSQQVSGAGGGGFLEAGGAGTIDLLLRLPTDPPDDTAPPAQGGVAAPFIPSAAGVDAIDHFMIGGSGGGGGGTASTLVRPTIFVAQFLRFTNAFGGGGGGGAIGLRIGGNFAMAPSGTLSLRGGSTQSSTGNTWQSRGTSVGGGGSGGSAVLQVRGAFNQTGTIDLRGGDGGIFQTTATNGRVGQSTGGMGAPGYVRYEGPGATFSQLGTVLGPTALTNQNAGPLSGSDPQSVAVSAWYPLNSILPPVLVRYEVTATIGGVTQTFTDDPQNFNPINYPGSPVEMKLQGAQLDLVSLVPIDQPGPWVDTIAELAVSQPTGFRFLMTIDTAIEPNVVIEEFKIIYQT